MRRILSRGASWPLVLSGVLLGFVLAWLCRSIWVSCGGHIGYPMDDTYIHMAMAKSFSRHGVWGLTRYAFSSTSSSLLYTFILSVSYLITGTNELAPLLLNMVFGLLLLWFCDYALEENGVAPRPRALALIVILFVMPLPALIISGMEHVLHTLLTMVFVYVAVRLLTQPVWRRAEGRWLLVLSALTVLSRYEALALVLVTAIVFFWRKRRGYAFALMVCGALPVALFGFYSVAQGWFPVPNSIVAKASRPGISNWPYAIHWVEQLYYTPAASFLGVFAAALLAALYFGKRVRWTVEVTTFVLFLPTLLLHMQFARVGWFFRYEGYLLVFGVYACALGLSALGMPSWRYAAGYAVAGLALIACCEGRVANSLWLPPYASANIYDQQYQMGLFLKKYLGTNTVVLTDIGAAGYLSDARIVDFFGLSTIEVARAKVHHGYTRDFRRGLAAKYGARMAILYKHEYDSNVSRKGGGLPAEWTEVGSWRIPANQICWSDTVTFYAIDPAFEAQLIADLKQFSPGLPHGVTQTGLYTVSGDEKLRGPMSGSW